MPTYEVIGRAMGLPVQKTSKSNTWQKGYLLSLHAAPLNMEYHAAKAVWGNGAGRSIENGLHHEQSLLLASLRKAEYRGDHSFSSIEASRDREQPLTFANENHFFKVRMRNSRRRSTNPP